MSNSSEMSAGTTSAAIIESTGNTTIHGSTFTINMIQEKPSIHDLEPGHHNVVNSIPTEPSTSTEKAPIYRTKTCLIIVIGVGIIVIAAITGGVAGVLKKKSTQAGPVLVLPNPLVRDGDPPQPGMILIMNNGSMSVQVAVSGATSTNVSATFLTIPPGGSETWMRTGKETVFINGGGRGRVATAIAEPGSYKVQKLDYTDANVDYVFNSDSHRIGVKNNLNTTIQVKLTTNTHSDGSERFIRILPGATKTWTRNGLETAFILYPSSDILLSYLGISGRDLQVNGQSKSPAPIVRYVKDVQPNQIRVHNSQPYPINVKTCATSTNGSEWFYTIPPNLFETWTRNKSGVVFVNGPNGTAVEAYHADPSYTLFVDNAVSRV